MFLFVCCHISEQLSLYHQPHNPGPVESAPQSPAEEILSKELPPPYRENEDVPDDPQIYEPNPIPPCEVLDLLANCKIPGIPAQSDVEYAEIQEQPVQEMGLWHSTPLAHRHKSKISLTWVLKENAENTKPQNDVRYQRQFEDRFKTTKLRETRVVGRNEYYHNLRFRSACEEFVSQDTLSDETSTEEYVRRKHRHRHRRKKRNQERFGYDIRDLDSFLSEASIDHPGNIPVVIAYPTTLYQTQKDLQREVTLPLGTVVNAVFKNKQWLYVQTPHGDEGYVVYSACLPLGILPNRTSQKKTPCWESSTDIYPRPCGNLTDNEKEQLRTRTRSETRYKPRKQRCAEKDFDSLYLRTKSVCSNIDNIEKKSTIDKRKIKRQTLLVVNSDHKGSVLNKTLTVREGDVVVLVERGETDVDADWFYVRKRDGSQGFIPAVIAGHGYI
ncbi:uncharacterized protein LOC134742000 isoform X1 [Cydia strobilella]|uniref:uncharacterized protein LOC134742000 isoform X1 n=1 Tax=Cydia strobilella TaxID=1100964 RepID=UPI0030052D12